MEVSGSQYCRASLEQAVRSKSFMYLHKTLRKWLKMARFLLFKQDHKCDSASGHNRADEPPPSAGEPSLPPANRRFLRRTAASAGEPPLRSGRFKCSPADSSGFLLFPSSLLSPLSFRGMDAAIAKLTPLGLNEDDICDTIYEILQAFDNDPVMGWRFAQENNYKMVVSFLEYKRMEDDQTRKKASENDIYEHEGKEFDDSTMSLNPTKCFGMESDEEDRA